MRPNPLFALLLLALSLPAAGRGPSRQPDLTASLWLQTAAEHAVLARQTYRQARNQLVPALADPTWSAALEQRASPAGDYVHLPPAVILDLDETVFDNGPVEVQFARTGGFDRTAWDAWVARAEAAALPGALEFARTAAALDVALVYVSNRACAPRPGDGRPCPQEDDCIRNLERLGFPPVTPARILLRNEQPDWSRDKSSRRAALSRQYRILQLIGDDLGDFLPRMRDLPPGERRAQALERNEFWGERWFLLPNPAYGSWLQALRKHPEAGLAPP